MAIIATHRSCRWLHHDTGILVVSFLACMGASSVANAQFKSSIAIWGDPNYPWCEIPDTPGERTVYVVHTFNTGTTAARFKIESGPGNTMTYLSETHYFASTLGNTQDGISVCYGTCTFDNVPIVSITYMAYGTSSSCSRLLVVPHPSAQTVEAINCGGVASGAYGEDLTLHFPGGGCGCPVTHYFPGTPQVFNCSPVAVQNTTWGAIKALYRK